MEGAGSTLVLRGLPPFQKSRDLLADFASGTLGRNDFGKLVGRLVHLAIGTPNKPPGLPLDPGAGSRALCQRDDQVPNKRHISLSPNRPAGSKVIRGGARLFRSARPIHLGQEGIAQFAPVRSALSCSQADSWANVTGTDLSRANQDFAPYNLESENAQLKRLVAELVLANQTLKEQAANGD